MTTQTDNKYRDFLTPICLIDNASLVVPTKSRDEKGEETGEPKYRVRVLMKKADVAVRFRRGVAEICKQLLNGTTQIHPSFTPQGKNVDSSLIVKDFFKVGSDVLQQKKDYDADLEEGEKKKYSPALDYLEDYFYFYATSKFPIDVLDQLNKKVIAPDDNTFRPSFKGRIKFRVKWNPVVGSPNPKRGGYLTAYLQAVQYLSPATENFMREEIKFDPLTGEIEEAFDFAESDTEYFEPAYAVNAVVTNAPIKNSAKAKDTSLRQKDDLDEYVEGFSS